MYRNSACRAPSDVMGDVSPAKLSSVCYFVSLAKMCLNPEMRNIQCATSLLQRKPTHEVNIKSYSHHPLRPGGYQQTHGSTLLPSPKFMGVCTYYICQSVPSAGFHRRRPSSPHANIPYYYAECSMPVSGCSPATRPPSPCKSNVKVAVST